MPISGKLLGALIGSIAGPLGTLLGGLIGHFFDRAAEERRFLGAASPRGTPPRGAPPRGARETPSPRRRSTSSPA